jgi:hypothetical protein
MGRFFTVVSFVDVLDTSRMFGVVGDPKTAKSKAPVPVIPQLAQRLDDHREKMWQTGGWTDFRGHSQTPARLERLLDQTGHAVRQVPSKRASRYEIPKSACEDQDDDQYQHCGFPLSSDTL